MYNITPNVFTNKVNYDLSINKTIEIEKDNINNIQELYYYLKTKENMGYDMMDIDELPELKNEWMENIRIAL